MGTAYVDESMRLTGEQPMYLLGATVFEGDSAQGVSMLIKQKAPGAPKRLWFPDLILGAYGDALTEDSLPKAWIDAWEGVEGKTDFQVISI